MPEMFPKPSHSAKSDGRATSIEVSRVCLWFGFILMLLLVTVLFVSACARQQDVAPDALSAAQLTISPMEPTPLQTNVAPIRPVGTLPPTTTPVLPPNYKTPTPIPPEHEAFFIYMGNGGIGQPAIQ